MERIDWIAYQQLLLREQLEHSGLQINKARKIAKKLWKSYANERSSGGIMEWIKANKKLVIPIVVVIMGGIAMIADVISWEDFMSIFERVNIPVEGGG
jgi:hypothetical protein